MNTIWDVLRRIIDARPLAEHEQKRAHEIIDDHEENHPATAAADDGGQDTEESE